MKKFILKFLKIITPIITFVCFTIIYYCFSSIKFNKEFQKISINEILIMGDSQAQRIPENISEKKTVNLASSGEHFYFTFKKLKKLTENNDFRIKKIILGVGPHNFFPIYNRFGNINFAEGKSDLERYLYYLNLKNDFKFIEKTSNLISYLFIKGIYSNPKIYGFHESNNQSPNLDIILKGINQSLSINKNEDKISFSQREYLIKIHNFCVKNDIKLILLTTPYHPEFYKRIPKEYFEFFEETLSMLPKGVHFNYAKDNIGNEYMSDGNHLNKLGAEKYSKIISNHLISLDKWNKQ